MSTSMILRVVACGKVDDGDCDLDAPCDLVALELQEDGTERELDRKEFETGHEASKYLMSLVRR